MMVFFGANDSKLCFIVVPKTKNLKEDHPLNFH